MMDYKDLIFDDSLKMLSGKPGQSLQAEQEDKEAAQQPNHQYEARNSKEINPRSLLYVPADLSWKSNAKPFLILSSTSGASQLVIEYSSLLSSTSLPLLSGNTFHSGVTPLASNYGGYQNGSYQILGDGRTVYLGNYGKNTFQMRGIGPTAVSGKDEKDGLITLLSAINEFFVSEALAKLKIPTIRCLSVVASPYPCSRSSMKVFYTTAHNTRFAPSFTTFGHFDYFHLRGDHRMVKILTDSIIENFFQDAIQMENKEMLHLRELFIHEKPKTLRVFFLLIPDINKRAT